VFPLNPPIDSPDDHGAQSGAAEPADLTVQPEEQPAPTLPTMADLDRLSMVLDGVDDTLDDLDRRG
jgi:hypothetical protein